MHMMNVRSLTFEGSVMGSHLPQLQFAVKTRVQENREPCLVDLLVPPSGQVERRDDPREFWRVAIGVQTRLAVLETVRVVFVFVQFAGRSRQVVFASVPFADHSRRVAVGTQSRFRH